MKKEGKVESKKEEVKNVKTEPEKEEEFNEYSSDEEESSGEEEEEKQEEEVRTTIFNFTLFRNTVFISDVMEDFSSLICNSRL